MDTTYEEHFTSRNSFIEFIKNNNKKLYLKFTAEWCQPCKVIQPHISKHFETLSKNGAICLYVDIEEYFDVYVFLKSKKMISGIPTVFYYKPSNDCAYAPDNVFVGANDKEIDKFFNMTN